MNVPSELMFCHCGATWKLNAVTMICIQTSKNTNKQTNRQTNKQTREAHSEIFFCHCGATWKLDAVTMICTTSSNGPASQLRLACLVHSA